MKSGEKCLVSFKTFHHPKPQQRISGELKIGGEVLGVDVGGEGKGLFPGKTFRAERLGGESENKGEGGIVGLKRQKKQ